MSPTLIDPLFGTFCELLIVLQIKDHNQNLVYNASLLHQLTAINYAYQVPLAH